jgi:hypothetical protein
MKRPQPCSLALRALNQYRQRDVVSYLGLRYLLDNSAARTERWATEVSVENLLKRTDAPYYRVQHFKCVDENGQIEHRAIYLPTPQEALAECALISAIHERHADFPHSAVFSYLPPKCDDTSGPFARYFTGLQNRHAAIAKACEAWPDGVVQYVDIKKFYPSISIENAQKAWNRIASEARLSAAFQDCGRKILDDHGKIQQADRRGLLTGPVFSHMIANAILHDIDLEYAHRKDVVYLRYVDDIVLVGKKHAVSDAVERLSERLANLGLALHDPESSKCFSISTNEWLSAKDDYSENSISRQWMIAVAALKRSLRTRPSESPELQKRLLDAGFRIPLLDYSGLVQERTYMEQLGRIFSFKWLPKEEKAPSPKDVVMRFLGLRQILEGEYSRLIQNVDFTHSWQKKRFLPRLRYVVGRMLFVSTTENLANNNKILAGIPEMHFYKEVASALIRNDVSSIIDMGANAAQATAQLLKSSGQLQVSASSGSDEISIHSLAILALNGIKISPPRENSNDFLRFSRQGPDLQDLSHQDPFLSEIFCLHGLSTEPRHARTLASAFHPSDELTFDAIEQFKGSAY